MLGDVFRGKTIEDGSAVIVGRLVDKTKTLYTQAGLSSIAWRVVVKSDGSEVIASTALTISQVVFDTPFAWDGSAQLANFRHVTASNVFTTGATVYQAQYTFTATDGTVGRGVVELETVDLVGA